MSIILNSDKRTNQTDSSSEFKLRFQYPLQKGEYELKYVCMPFTITTINNNNNTFLLNGSVVTLPTGDYVSVEKLRNILETTLQSIDLNFSVVVNNNNITINNTSRFVLDFTDSELGTVLGFQKRLYISTMSQTGSGIVNLNPLTSINIIVNNLCTLRDNENLAYSFRIPVISDKNSFITYEPITFKQTINFTSPQHLLNIRLCDDKFKTLDLQGIHWWAILHKID